MECFDTFCGGLNDFRFDKFVGIGLKMKVVKEVESGYGSGKDEVEEGELGTLKWPTTDNGDFVRDKSRRFEIKSEVEKSGYSVDRWRKGGDVEKGEFSNGKWRKGDLHKLEFSSGRLEKVSRRGEFEKTEFVSRRVGKEEGDKGEFISDRWRGRSEVVRDENNYVKMRRYEHSDSKDKGWKPDFRWTPPTAKYSGEKDFSRNGNQFPKRVSRLEGNNQERTTRINPKFVHEEWPEKNDFSNGKSHGRDFASENRLKRHAPYSDTFDRKHRSDFSDHTPSKSRRLSDDGSRTIYPDQSYKNSFSSRSADKYSSRNFESPLPSRGVRDRHNSSPHHSERSPRDRGHYYDHLDRSSERRDRSPYARSRHYDYRNRSPSYSEWSPQDQGRHDDHREQTPSSPESPPSSRVKPNNFHETDSKGTLNEKRQIPSVNKGQEEKLGQVDSTGLEMDLSTKDSEDRINLDNHSGSLERNSSQLSLKEKESFSLSLNCESPQVNGTTEELVSMEEDMDICDTPPHASVVVDSTTGKWFYLDHYGVEQGPSKLDDLKMLVEEGFLVSDHLIKHLDSDRWITVENAVSPLVAPNFPSIFSDAVTQLVSPSEAPENVLADVGDVVLSSNHIEDKALTSLLEPANESSILAKSPEDFHIDERIEALFDGFSVVAGRELETVGEVLQMKFEHGAWERWEYSEGFTSYQHQMIDHKDKIEDVSTTSYLEISSKEMVGSWSSGPLSTDMDISFNGDEVSDLFSGQWSCKGGDWKRIDEPTQDRGWKKKSVLNDGYTLCQMPISGQEDPRWQCKEELYYPSQGRSLDLPSWAFSSSDESGEYNCGNKLSQIKYFGTRGTKGIMLPVIRINTCVVKDHGSFVSEPRVKVRGKERYSSRSSRHYSSTSDSKRSSEERVPPSKDFHEQDSQTARKTFMLSSIPKDRLSTADDLQLHIGDWYYLDGAGHEQGPLSFPELQILADQGIIQKHTSVFRKLDKVWVPVTSASEAVGKSHGEHSVVSTNNSTASNLDMGDASVTSFHCLHPQYIGYTRGKLHELIMKSYRSRELAAAINEALEPWINERQPKKEIEKQIYSSASSNQYLSSDQVSGNRRARMVIDGVEEDKEIEDDVLTVQEKAYSFENLCRDATFGKEGSTSSLTETASWGLLDGFVLARVFHFLRADIKSLVYAASTCKYWRSVTKFYKDISTQADLSAIAAYCTDSMMLNIMSGYSKDKITSLILRGCSNITTTMLEDVLRLFPCVSYVDIRGCSQFEDLTTRFPNIVWVKSHGLYSNLRNVKQTAETSYDARDSLLDESTGLSDYFKSQDKRDSANQLFRQSLYKRSKVFDARKSSSLLSRGAQLRRLAIKKSENGYKRMKEFLALGLKDIMKENTFDFFGPRVAEIEDRMKNGYYAGRGLSSVKEDISRMCRDALKGKNRGDTRDMNRIVTLFIRLATSLEASYKSSYERDKIMRTWKDDSPPGFTSVSSKYKKHTNVAEKKYSSRSNGSFVNGGADYGEYASDREIRRRLSKLNKKSFGSGSETSDDQERSSEETETDSDSTASDTDSDGDRRSEAGPGESRGDSNSTIDDAFESTADDREWGARMTKASLVPPVTRKYEVIDRYVVVADEEEVQRKMQVSLPVDYAEKLIAQKNGTEESDMDCPEVKDYKPRKQLGDEVIEQEVYGIDPYTHNLLLDSMPDESDWTLSDKHIFIEEVLLRALNKKVRNFTGTGNTPMVYSLQPVIRDILRTSEEQHDTRTTGLCMFMLKAMSNRQEDNYVAYRKGLGVVCNKEGGFGEDDFVVEFLGEVYPAWKWFEKQDGIRALQKDSKEPAPEFYNIYLERPKGDADGYDLVVVDAMHKANYASRICHSCKPNCEAKVTAVDGQYQIGIYSVRPIGYGEEVTFDYNSVTESKEEYEASVCLCGSQICRGSYLNFTGEGAFQKVLKDCHGLLNRHQLMLEACELNAASDEDYIDLGKAGLGSCLLGGLPDWLIAYAARLVRFINFERTKLPEEILRHNLEEKRKYFTDISLDVEKSDAEVQAEGVYNQRLQNLALTLNKVRYVMRCVFGDPKKAPPLLERLSPEEAVSFVWKGEGSFVEELIECISPYMEDWVLKDLRSNIRSHDPSGSENLQRELRKSLLWLRDEVRNLPCTYKCRHDAAADLIHIYAFTNSFFRIREYKAVTSPPVYISPLDLGPKSADKLGPGFHEYRKSYGENYCLGQLIFWHNQANAEPDGNLARASRGCLSLPEIGSFYAKVQKPSRQRVYGPRTVKSMLSRMEKQPQKPWPKDKIWSFKSAPKVIGSPMLDAVLRNAPLDRELIHWLKHRPPIFQAMWDR